MWFHFLPSRSHPLSTTGTPATLVLREQFAKAPCLSLLFLPVPLDKSNGIKCLCEETGNSIKNGWGKKGCSLLLTHPQTSNSHLHLNSLPAIDYNQFFLLQGCIFHKHGTIQSYRACKHSLNKSNWFAFSDALKIHHALLG